MAKLPNLWFFGAFFRSKRQNMSYPELKSQVITTKWNKINDRRQRQTIHWRHLTSTPNKSEDAWVSLWYVPPPSRMGLQLLLQMLAASVPATAAASLNALNRRKLSKWPWRCHCCICGWDHIGFGDDWLGGWFEQLLRFKFDG